MVPIPPRGVDYRGKVVLAPMVRSGELPSRLMALHYGADLVWGPETIDMSMIGTTRTVNTRTNTIEWSRMSSNSGMHVPAAKASILYRIHPELEGRQLIFQMGTSDPKTAVAAARLVAADVAGIDVNAGCPKPFSTSGGMGAALLRTPDLLVSILEALVADIVPAYGIGISVKIRILPSLADTEALVRRLVRTGITGLTVHCRTPSMRPREHAVRDARLDAVVRLCREAGVACVLNGDVASRDDALQLMRTYGADAAMIATAAERNPSVFRAAALGGLAPWREVVAHYMAHAVAIANRFGNTKFMLAQMVPGKQAEQLRVMRAHSYLEVCSALGLTHLLDHARHTDRILAIDPQGLQEKKDAKAALQKSKRKPADHQPNTPADTDLEVDDADENAVWAAAAATVAAKRAANEAGPPSETAHKRIKSLEDGGHVLAQQISDASSSVRHPTAVAI